MREIPECLSRRYKALDEMIKELTLSAHEQGAPEGCAHTRGTDAGIKLLCNFWNILKEDPDYDLVHAVQHKLGLAEQPREEGHAFCSENIACYMAGKCCRKNDNYDQGRESHHKFKKMCSSNDNNPKCCASRSISPMAGSEILPLSKVLCNLKEAASFDKKCNVRINELMETQKVLQDQIQHLEHREKEGVQLLKQADCMWTCMEDTYNKKINESSERQKMLMQQLKELEASTTKWRKNKKDLELQLVSVSKCHEEISEKINQKNSDFKCMNVEIEDFKKRLESNKKDMEAVKNSFGTKKQASEAKISKIAAEISKLEKVVIEERRFKNNKEQEGSQYVQEARADLQKICKVLLQKKIENEDLRAQKEALNFELDILKQTYDQCKHKCKNRQQEISDEIAKVEKKLKEFSVKCTRCHECTDTVDIRRCCTDCPRCVELRDCIIENDHCTPDHTIDCVCTTVKKKFLDNVFDNMYTVLERQVKTGPGKAVGDAVLNSLKRSRNGKLDGETRKILQEFILTTVKKNLNLTIVGGAVKTRCEMDPDTYNQLMLCLQQVKVVKPPKEDKATPAKKDSCRRWGGVSECNCPKGPKACICLKKAPPPPQDPSPCPPPTHDEDDEGVVIKCPHRDTAECGADCAMHAVPSRVGADIAAWRPDPCKEQSCRFSNMRAAQCVLGPESLVSLPKGCMSTIPQVPVLQDLDNLMTCKCGCASTKPCNCQDHTGQPRERIIEEVMGRYGDIQPIAKVISEDEFSVAESNRRKQTVKNDMSSDINENYAFQSKITIPHNTLPLETIHTKPNKHEKTENNCSKYELVTLYYNNSESNEFVESNKINNGMHTGIATNKLHSQFTESCSKKTKNVGLGLIDLHEVQTTDKKDECIPTTDKSVFERKCCDTVKKLLKGIIVRDEVNNMRNESKCEWVTVDSLMREITSLTKISEDNRSNVTSNEVEIKVESLENLKTNKQYNIIHDANKSISNCYLQQMKLPFIFDNLIDSELVKKRITKCDGSFPKVSTNDSKQLKAGIIKPCDKVNCGSLWNEVKEKVNNSYSLIEKEINKETYRQEYSVQSKKVPSVKAHVLSGDQRNLSTKISLPAKSYDNKNDIFVKDAKEEKIKQYFKVIINDADIAGDQFTELKTTESGNLALELDEKVIRLIDEKLREDPNIFVSLDETDSENYIMNFSPLEITKNKKRTISIKKTTSGTTYLEIQKEFVNKLKHNELNNNIINKKTDTDQINNTCQAICDCKDHTGNIYKVSSIKNVSNQKSYLSEVRRLWDEGTKDIFIKVVAKNGLCKEIKGTLTKNVSGDIVVDVTNISSLGDITLTGECSAVLTPTNSDTFLLEICHDDNNFNVILRRSKVGRIILVATKTALKPQYTYETRPKNELFRVKIQSSNKLVEEPPAVLKMTPSRNYTFVLDKEYEKTFENTIDECIGNDSECFVEVNKTNSGNFLVVLDDNEMLDDCEPNALLTKSPSGHIKMVVQETMYKSVDSSPRKISTSSSRAFSQLLDKLPPFNQHIKRDNFKIPLNDTKLCSGSRLKDKVTMKQLDNNDLPEPSVTLTRTASGQYVIVLNKESKKAFVNQLRSYLIGSHGLIPINRKETGEITIDLNSNSESNNCGYGSLKISPSGNIYVTVNKNIIEGLVEDVKCSEGSCLGEVLSKHIITSIKNPVNKSVTTTCNSKPETCSCDVSKCVCNELQFYHNWWSQNNSSYLKCQNHCVDLKKVGKKSSGRYKICNPQKCKESNCAGSKSKDSSANKSPYIVIKPCDGSPVLPENPRSEECCYVVEAIRPHHIDKHETVPNELMEISGLSNDTLEKRNHAVVYPRIKTKDNAARDRSWDSLNYLPQQLPRFLQDANFR